MTIGVTHHHPTCLEVPNIRLKRGLKHLSFPIRDIVFQNTERMIFLQKMLNNHIYLQILNN